MLKFLFAGLLFVTTAQAEDFVRTPEPDFGAEFTKNLPKKDSMDEDAKKAALRGFADTYLAEGDYVRALSLLGETPDGTVEWYEVYGSAANGDRNQKKALWAFKEAKKMYEAQGNSDKVNQMNALINTLEPK
ncbi:MAG: hypothetical protein ACK5LE_02675 [Alphaproteobacteria bacterium]